MLATSIVLATKQANCKIHLHFTQWTKPAAMTGSTRNYHFKLDPMDGTGKTRKYATALHQQFEMVLFIQNNNNNNVA